MCTLTETSTAPRPYREAIALLKQDIKNDSESLRQQKRDVRHYQRVKHGLAPSAQVGLASSRRNARARFVVYGLLRGRRWDQIEKNHPDGDERLKQPITAIWQALVARLDTPVEASLSLKPWLLR